MVDPRSGTKLEVLGFAASPDTFAGMVVFAMSQPEDVDINEILFRPVSQEF